MKDLDWLPAFVEQHLSFTGKCFRHCDKLTSMKAILQDSNRVLGAYICPDGFVSQVVYFSQKPDLNWFNDTISNQVGADNFTTNDVRLATRHGWELGREALQTLEKQLGPNPSIREVYWTRYAKTDEQKQVAISLCVGDSSRSGCLKLFAHPSNQVQKLCSACKRR